TNYYAPSRPCTICSTHFPYTTLFRSRNAAGLVYRVRRWGAPSRSATLGIRVAGTHVVVQHHHPRARPRRVPRARSPLPVLRSLGDRKSTRLKSSHVSISYAVVCL